MVEQSRNVAPAGAAARRPSARRHRVGILDVLAGREHGDDDLCAPHGLLRAVRHGDAVLASDVERGRDHIESRHGYSRLHQVHGHGTTHVTQSQERNVRRVDCR